MSEKISRRDFLKKSGILGAGLFFAFSKFGNMPAVKAAVSDNSASNDISKDTIYTTQVTAEDPFRSGQTASDLAHAVNQLNVSLSEYKQTVNSQLSDLQKSVENDFIRKDQLIFTADSSNNLTITKKY